MKFTGEMEGNILENWKHKSKNGDINNNVR